MEKFALRLKIAIPLAVLFTTGMTAASPQANPTVGVAVWDSYFDRQSPDGIATYFDGTRNGTLKDVFYWDAKTQQDDAKAGAAETGFASHGFKTSFVIADGQPFVDIQSIFNDYLPWQDPELCRLVDFPAAPALEQGLPDCRELAAQGISRLKEFLHNKQIRLINLSAGTYYPNYTPRNRLALQLKFPSLELQVIDQFLLKNFLAIGQYADALVESEPGIFFVFAAGNTPNLDVDKQVFPDWAAENAGKTGLPIWYASIAEKHLNSIAVTAGSADVSAADAAFIDDAFGNKSVSMAVRNSGVRVPTKDGMDSFRGSSAAAVQLTKLVARAIYMYSEKGLSPEYLKKALTATVDHVDALDAFLVTGGVLNEEKFLAKIQTDFGPPLHAYNPPVPYPAIHSGEFFTHRFLDPVSGSDRKIQEFSFHLQDDLGQPTGCLIAKVADNGDVWMTLPGRNQVGQFKQDTQELLTYDAPTALHTPSGPDGLTIDDHGRIWIAEYDAGNLWQIDPGVIDPKTGRPQSKEFVTNPSLNVAIPTIDSSGTMWITSHQARKVLKFNSQTEQFTDSVSLGVGWPLDILIDSAHFIWVAGGLDFTLGNTPNGALVRIDPKTLGIDYYGIPSSISNEQIVGYWLAEDRDEIFMTMGKQGIFSTTKATGDPTVYDKRNGNQYFFTAASLLSKNEVAFADEPSAGPMAIQVFKPDLVPPKMTSYLLPTQQGQFSEGLTYDQRSGDIWYCQRNPPILGVLRAAAK